MKKLILLFAVLFAFSCEKEIVNPEIVLVEENCTVYLYEVIQGNWKITSMVSHEANGDTHNIINFPSGYAFNIQDGLFNGTPYTLYEDVITLDTVPKVIFNVISLDLILEEMVLSMDDGSDIKRVYNLKRQ